MKQEWIQVTSDGAKDNLSPKTTAGAVYIDDSLTSTVEQALLANTSVAAYTHTYNPGNGVHAFVGEGMVGWARVSAPYTPDDAFTLNGVPVKAYAPRHDPLLTCFEPGRTVVFTRSNDAIEFQTCGARAKMRDAELYGVRIDKADPNLKTRCTYLFDAVGKRRAKMIYKNADYRFDCGDWGNVGFVRENRPVMLRSDGTVAYALDPTNLALRADGGASDIANTAFDGNAMSEMPRWWLKQYEDADYQYILVSNVQYDDDFHAYAFTHEDGTPAEHLYLPMYRGSYSNGRLRSLSGQPPMIAQIAPTELARAAANGACWGTKSWAQVDYVNALLTLISCSTDHQKAFGKGKCAYGGGFLDSGSLNSAGQFFGYNDNDAARVKVFWCEDWWGHLEDRIAGMVKKNERIYVKMTPPYDWEGTDYIEAGMAPTGNSLYGTDGYIQAMHFSEYGKIPCVVGDGASTSTYWPDFFTWGERPTAYAIMGGSCLSMSDENSGPFCLSLLSTYDTFGPYNASLSALP